MPVTPVEAARREGVCHRRGGVLVDGVPVTMETPPPGGRGRVNTARLGEDVVAKTVCRHAIKANDAMRGPELDRLVEDLRRCDMPYTCPHGRPTLIELGWKELEKKFGRTG